MVIRISSLTGNIYSGRILRENVFAAGKKDVTFEVLCAVVQHVRHYNKKGKDVILFTDSGNFKITVEKL